MALLLCLPSLWTGLAMDDHLMARAVAQGHPGWDLFRFPGPATSPSPLEQGSFGWWAAPDLRVEFWRPLSSLGHALEFRLWDHAWPMHLHSALAYAALVLVASAVYRRLLGPGAVAGLATLLLAVDDSHAQAVGWIANRNLILSTTLGFAALWAHDRWRTDGWRAGAVLGPMLLLASLGSAEAGVTTLGYLVAHACFIDRDRWWRRALAIVPSLVVVGLWRLAYLSVDIQVAGSGVYRNLTVDFAADPWGVMLAAVRSTVILVTAQMTAPVANPLAASPRGWLWALAGLALLAVLILPVLRKNPAARFHALGMVLATVPFAATLPSDRILMPLGLGGSGLVAQLIASAKNSEFTHWRFGVLAKIFMTLHLWLSALLFIPSLLAVGVFERPNRALADVVSRHADTPVVVLVNIPFDAMLLWPPAIAHGLERPWPSHVYPLYAGRSTIRLRRVSSHAIELRSTAGWMASPLNRFARSTDRPMQAGQRISLKAMTVTIDKINGAGRPNQVEVVFDRPLHEIQWIAWIDGRPTEWSLPSDSENVALPTDLTLL